MKTTKKIGRKIKLYVNEENKEFVPSSVGYVDDGLLEPLAYAVANDMPVLIVGETGTGKTSAIRHLAKLTNNPYRRINLNGNTTADDLKGKLLINEKGTYWIDGVLIEAMRKGYWIVLDEINSALPEVLFVLQSLLDDDRMVVLEENGGEIVKPHPNFRVFATANPSDSYAGTKELNKALLSRFAIVAKTDFLPQEKEKQAVMLQVKAEEKTLDIMLAFAKEVRQAFKKDKIEFILSTRELINWAKLDLHYKDLIKSAELAFLGKCNRDDAEAVGDLLKGVFSSLKKAEEATI